MSWSSSGLQIIRTPINDKYKHHYHYYQFNRRWLEQETTPDSKKTSAASEAHAMRLSKMKEHPLLEVPNPDIDESQRINSSVGYLRQPHTCLDRQPVFDSKIVRDGYCRLKEEGKVRQI